MTKKHFEAVAEIMRQTRHNYRENDLSTVEYIEKQLAEYFGANNPLFNTQRFLMACKGEKYNKKGQ